MLRIDTLMNKGVVTASPADTVADVARRLKEASIGAVLIVEGGELAGIFSERDLVTRVIGAGKDPAATSVGSVATRDIVTVSPDASPRECANTLKAERVRHLPVVEDRTVVGIVSARDFFEAVAGELESYIERLHYDEQLRENVDPYDHIGGGYGR